MKLPNENERRYGLLKEYKNGADRYTPALKNGQWIALALIADVGWLLNLIFTALYFGIYGFEGDVVDGLYLSAVVVVQIGYLFDIYTSAIGEKAQQTKLQKCIGFGLPAVGSCAAFILGVVEASAPTDGLAYIITALIGAFISFVCCSVIFLSFRRVREREEQ